MKRFGMLALLLVFWLLTAAACAGGQSAPPAGEVAATQPAAEEAEAPAAEEPAAEEAAAEGSEITELTILWAQWDPADYLQEIGNLYEQETGIAVNIVQEPWGSFYDRAFTEFAAGGTSFDMIVGDSQWLGQGAEQGHYVELTDFMVGEGIDKTVTPATLTYYGEYPSGSGSYWAYPTECDADGWAYRM